MKRVIIILVVVLFAVLTMAAQKDLTVYLRGQEAVSIYCDGDELIVSQASDNEIQVTCRVWINDEAD